MNSGPQNGWHMYSACLFYTLVLNAHKIKNYNFRVGSLVIVTKNKQPRFLVISLVFLFKLP